MDLFSQTPESKSNKTLNEGLCAYMNSPDEKLLTNEQYKMLELYIDIKRRLFSEQRELELK